MLAVRLSIPLHWRQALSAGWTRPPVFPGGPTIILHDQEPHDVNNLSAKRVYSSLIASEKTANTALHRWKNNPPIVSVSRKEEWERVCLRVFKTVKETKLQSFQFKVIHAITPCRKYLRQLRIADDELCANCGITDDLFHFFFRCDLVRAL